MSADGTGLGFKEILQWSAHVPGDLLTAMFDTALAAGDRTLLKELVARPDAPAALQARFATLSDPTLAGIVAARAVPVASGPAREVREAALAAGLRTPNPSPAVVADALARFDARPTRTLADALYRGAPAAAVTAQQAYAILTRAHQPGRTLQERPDLFARLGPDLAAALLAGTDQAWHLQRLASFDLPTAAVFDALVRVALTHPEDRVELSSGLYYLAASRPLSLDDVPDAHMWAQRVAGYPAPAVRVANGLRQELDRAVRDRRRWREPHLWAWDLRAVVVPQSSSAMVADDAPAWWLHNAALCDDVALVEAVVDRLVRSPLGSGPEFVAHASTFTALLANPVLTPAARLRLVRWMCAAPRVQDRWTAREIPDVVGWFANEPDVVAAWCAGLPGHVLTRHGWAPFGGPEAGPALLERVAKAYERDRGARSWVRQVLEGAALAGVDSAFVAAMSTALRELALTGLGCPAREVYARACAQFLTRVAQDARVWGVFTTMAGGFTGTWGELVTVATALANESRTAA